MEKYEQRIREVLRRQNFIVGEREEDIIARRIRNGRRYFFMTAMRQEKDGTRERFVKIPRNDSKKLLIPFRRQLHITQYIQKRKGLLKTRAVIASNANPRQGIPYAVMETFPIHTSKIGFIEDNDEIRSLRARHGQKIVRQLHDFHNIRAEKLPRALQRTLVPYVKTYPRMRQQIFRYVYKKMRTEEFRRFRNPVIATMLSRRLGEPAVKEKIRSVFDRLSESMKRQDDLGHRALVQGDMSPKNLYVFDNGEVEFLDFEWAGYTGSRALAEVIDLGNLRARSWNNSEFQNALDEAYRNLYSEKGEEFLGKAIVALAILRSSILLIGFFENYSGDRRDMPEETQKRNVIENDIARILAMDI